jgi:hypothetical protein
MKIGDIIWGGLILIGLFLVLTNPRAAVGILSTSAGAVSQFIQDLQGRSRPR